MALSIERVNTYAAKYTIAGWLTGLAYYSWFSSSAPPLSVGWHALLIVGGMFASSIVIGGGVSLILALVTKLVTGKSDGSSDFFAWGAFISPVLAFLAAGYVVAWVGSSVSASVAGPEAAARLHDSYF